MRTIKFRGKSLSGEWLYGYLYKHGITPPSNFLCIGQAVLPWKDTVGFYVVDPDTVGQFTGMLDKNGHEIYEGDIIKIVEKFDDENVYTSNGVVCFEEGIYELQNGKHFAYLGWLMHNDDITKLEVIGNIHDNPDLIEKGGES